MENTNNEQIQKINAQILQDEFDIFTFSDELLAPPPCKDVEKQERNREKYSQIYSNCNKKLLTPEIKEQRFRMYVQNKRRNKKERKRLKRKEDKETNNYTPEHTYTEIIAIKKAEKEFYNQKLEKFKDNGCRIAIDLSFSNFMLPKEIKSLAFQLTLCMNAVKKSDFPIHLNFCSYKGDIKVEGDKMGFEKVNISYHEDPVENIYHTTKNQLVYLSPDAEEVVESFEQDKIYIIGGLVDNMIQKNRSMERAQDMNIVTRKLPLDFVDNIKKHRKCLNINTVVEIIVAYFSEKDMKKAIINSLPQKYFN